MRTTNSQACVTSVRRADRTPSTGRRVDWGHRRGPTRPAFEAEFVPLLRETFARDPEVVAVEPFPRAFEWIDGLDAQERKHVPLLLVLWRDGSRTYVDAMSHAQLVRDPELSGTRKRIEAECLARRATHEIWTEREIRTAQRSGMLLEVAGGADRTEYAKSGTAPRCAAAPLALFRNVADRFGIVDLRDVDGDWIGRDRLTGVLLVVLRGVRIDPVTKMVVWPPVDPGMSFTRQQIRALRRTGASAGVRSTTSSRSRQPRRARGLVSGAAS